MKKEFKITIRTKPFGWLMRQVSIEIENEGLFYWIQDFSYILDCLKKKYEINPNKTITKDFIIFNFHLPDFQIDNFKKDLKKILKLLEKKSTYKNYFSEEVITIKLPFEINENGKSNLSNN
ncbi:MAG: hypothetical protein ACO2PO_16960 [Candidatus Calescibacterium sp.]